MIDNELKVTVDWIMKFETFGDDYAELVKVRSPVVCVCARARV